MYNVIVVNPTDITGHPQAPNEVFMVQAKNLDGFLKTHKGALVMILDTDVMVPHPYQGEERLIDAPSRLKKLVEHVYFTLERYRSAIQARTRISNVEADRRSYEKRLGLERGANWQRPDNYVEWLEKHPEVA